MERSAKAIEELVMQRMVSAPGDLQAIKEQLRPIVRELLGELLPGALEWHSEKIMPRIDNALAEALRYPKQTTECDTPRTATT